MPRFTFATALQLLGWLLLAAAVVVLCQKIPAPNVRITATHT